MLRKPAAELAEEFLCLKFPRDIAELLEIPYRVLNYHLYFSDRTKQYATFSVRKKGGGTREICAPITPIKIIQRKLNYVLQLVYRRKSSVHGFIHEKSILTNAQKHARKEYVFNLDLQDFFPSINFGRVRGMFMANPYRLHPKVASVLARISCFNNQLPQGAPTSPIVSNMICARLDAELERLAKRYDCTYTRYADDITFSTNQPDFPSALAISRSSAIPHRATVELGGELSGIITRNGFAANPNKIWLYHADYRQSVTGLTVNSFPNVKRKFMNKVRAMLHAWEKYGLKAAEDDFLRKYDSKHRRPSAKPCLFKEVLKGRLNFLRMVRGPQNPSYLRFCGQLANMDTDFAPIFLEKIRFAASPADILVLECEETCQQGTAFFLRGVGLVSCEHTLGSATHAFTPDEPGKKYPVTIIHRHQEIDLAILKIDAPFVNAMPRGDSSKLKQGDAVKLAGFPNYSPGQTVQVCPGVVVGFKQRSGIRRIQINAPIIAGNSGGPVINEKGEVVGVAVTGADRPEVTTEAEYGVTPIDALDYLLNSSN